MYMTTKLMVTKSTVQKLTRKSPKSFTWKKKKLMSGNILSKVVVYLRIVFVPFQVLPIYEAFNPFLQISWFYWEFKLLKEFSYQKGMTQHFSGLHYPNNSSINLVLPVLKYSLSSACVLLNCFLHLDGIYLYTI
uniref:Uncharacterized protein n=1 Tax=Spongospora subterranea TaxID=70186 RepID=A0A0H5QZH1_9EUKA|eukprot:CRZ07117.1 hypothetical protein [Spongospora subterranea]